MDVGVPKFRFSMGNGNDVSMQNRRKMKFWSVEKIKYIICILTPLALLPLAVSQHKEAKCAYVILWMIVYWVLEPVHLTITALLPVPLLPLLGILESKEVTPNYMKEVLMMFVGGLGVATAVEYCNLHERVALKVLLTIGADRKWLVFGFMFTTMFLSMWISNTATTAMMVPIVDALMAELRKGGGTEGNNESSDEENNDKREERNNETSDKEKHENNLKALHKTLLISVAYSANCGGTGTITGTSPNMVFKGYMEELYPESSEITYASWMAYNIPGMVLCVFSAWLVLQALYVPCWRKSDKETRKKIRSVILSRYEELGPITFHEASVLGLFLLLVFLWVFREPKFMPGWADVFGSGKQIGDSVPAIAVLFLLFLLPAQLSKPYKGPRLLNFNYMQQKLPWGLVLLLGGGYALSQGAEKSGLSLWLGQQFNHLFIFSSTVVLTILITISVFLTEVMSNSAVTTILLPVVNQMALSFKVNPLYFMLPVSVTASYAFMLPVATGPNAIVFSTGYMKTIEMVKPGIIMNAVGITIQLFMIHTLGSYMFNFSAFPTWAHRTFPINSTSSSIN